MSPPTTTLATIVGRCSSLLLLKPLRLQDTGKFHAGTVLRQQQSGRKCMVLCGGIEGGVIACDASDGHQNKAEKPMIKGDTLEVMTNTKVTINHSVNIFRDPPKDSDRKVITKGWTTNVAAFDAMCPLGRGQSMIFIDESNGKSTLFPDITQQLQRDVESNVHSPNSFLIALDNSLHVPHNDRDVARVLQSFVSCALAEQDRDAGRDAVVAIDDLSCFHRVWERAVKLALPAQDQHQHRRHRGELRAFYSNFVQRAANMSLPGQGSLTLLMRLPISPSSSLSSTTTDVISLDDIRREVTLGMRPVADLDRLNKLVSSSHGISLTYSILNKLNIRPPTIDADSEHISSLRMHMEELMSLCDGHCTTSATTAENGGFPFDPRRSLTRIGAGRLQRNEIRDTRSRMLRSVAKGLRLEVTDLMASTTHDPNALPQLELWRKILNDPSHDAKRHAALIWAVREGWRQNESMVDAWTQQLDLDKDVVEQVVRGG